MLNIAWQNIITLLQQPGLLAPLINIKASQLALKEIATPLFVVGDANAITVFIEQEYVA